MNAPSEPRQIERKMEKTRSRIDDTLVKIEAHVSPSAVQSVAHEGMRQARRLLEQEADRRLQAATSEVSKAGSVARDFIQQHPVLIAAVGVAVGLLLRSRQNRQPELPVITKDKETEKGEIFI